MWTSSSQSAASQWSVIGQSVSSKSVNQQQVSSNRTFKFGTALKLGLGLRRTGLMTRPMYSICQSLSRTTHKIYGKCTAAILVFLKLPAELSINSNWLLRFVLLYVINFIGWRVYSCLVKFSGCTFFKQLNYHWPTTREIKACDKYYTWDGLINGD